ASPAQSHAPRSRRRVSRVESGRDLRLHPVRDLVFRGDQRRVPCKARLEPPSRRIKRVAEMLLDFRLRRVLLSGLLERIDRLVDLAALELRPAERIGDRGIVWREL